MEKDGLIPTTTTTNGGGGLSWQALVGEMKNNNNNNNNNNYSFQSKNNNYSSCNSGGGVDQLATAPFLNLNWDQSSEQQAGNFESALSSLVSSPTASSSAAAAAAAAANSDSVVIRELIGRLGSICNNPNSPPNSQYQSSTNTSCYTTPLNSPPKLNLTMTMTMMQQQQQQQQQLMPFAADPGFVERAARFSCFGAGQRSYNNPQLVGVGVGELSSSQSLQKSNAGVQMGVNVMESSDHGGGQLDNDDDAMMMSMMMMTMMRPEDSAGSGRERMAASGGGEGNVRKRKAKAKPKAKDTAATAAPPLKMADEENSNANKRCKSAPENGVETGKVEQDGESAHKQPKDKEKDNNAKPAEPPKLDYIHVRARRGQATDSHSLAERVRREKISERMKFLQDLVPGCNKVTGKAVMLDEIINYVQSLQRQVEFLSMKLATVNPRLDFNADGLLHKDTQQPASGLVSASHLSFPLEQATSAAFSYSKQPQGQGQVPPHPSLQCFLTAGGMDTQCSVNPLDNGLRRSLSMHLPPLDGSFMDAASQLGAFWEDDLQSVVQMGFGQQNQLETISFSHNLQGTLPTNHMKIEL